jgi:two-component system chemotaxis sensor kinase CheA
LDEFLKDFLKDTREDLNKIESNLVHLEKKISSNEEIDFDVVNTIFRHFHSIKGSSGFFHLSELVRVAHQAENILDSYRKKTLAIEADSLDVIFKVRDFIGEIVERIEETGSDKGLEETADELIEELKKLETKENSKKPIPEVKKKKFGLFSEEKPNEEPPKQKKFGLFIESEKKEEVVEKVKKFGLFTAEVNDLNPPSTETNLSETIAEPKQIFTPRQATRPAETKIPTGNEIKDIRVTTDKLDSLLDLLGELVIVEAMVSRQTNDGILNVEMLRKAAFQLGKVTRNLQEVGLAMRMVPVSGLFQKMTRLVRDLSKQSNKPVNFKVIGEETEIDKTIVEQLSDPLVHMIRNSLDHGMETKEERANTNKSITGNISLEAKHKGNEIWIIIRDDGRGLNREKILKKAKEQNIISTNGAELSDEEVWNLIFEPGFSTAEKITDLSGRGVGMDVVRKNIHQIKGKIDIKSTFGEGTSIYLRIPLTLAIIDAIVVKYSDRYYVLPTDSIDRFVDLTIHTVSEIYDNQELIRIGEQLISLINLNNMFKYKKTKELQSEKVAVVIGKNKEYVAIRLDEIIGPQQVVVKSLDDTMDHLEGISGSAILGDGQVGLILEPEYIIRKYVTSKINSFTDVTKS